MVAGLGLGLVALVFVAGGVWGLWKDRINRDGQGFVPIGTEVLRTEQYAIVGDLQGAGPSWLYGTAVLGDVPVRATSASERPLFVGIARKGDLLRYLGGAGYATVYGFQVRTDTTHPGAAPSGAASGESIWVASTAGTGQRTLEWTPRPGDWSVVFMNADASAGVDVRGDAGAKLPILPWLAAVSLLVGAVAGVPAARLLVRAIRRATRPAIAAPGSVS